MEKKKRKRPSKLVFVKASDGWHWRIISGNGWIIETGLGGHATKSNAKRSFKRMLEGLDLDKLLRRRHEETNP